MPPVMKRAQTDRQRAILGVAIFYAIAAVEVLGQIPFLLRAHAWIDYWGPFGVTSTMVIMGFGLYLAMRGTWEGAQATPLELLAALERRHAGRRRLGRYLIGSTAYLVVLMMSELIVKGLIRGRVSAVEAVGVTASAAFTALFVGLVNRRVQALIDRELREATEARQLLMEE